MDSMCLIHVRKVSQQVLIGNLTVGLTMVHASEVVIFGVDKINTL